MPTLANSKTNVKFRIGKATIDENGVITAVSEGEKEHVDLAPVLKGLPDFAENKEQIEDTVLASDSKTYIEGLKDYGQLEFTCNFSAKKAKELKALGKDGLGVYVQLADGQTKIMYGISDIAININAASSGALMEMTIATYVSTDLVYN